MAFCAKMKNVEDYNYYYDFIFVYV